VLIEVNTTVAAVCVCRRGVGGGVGGCVGGCVFWRCAGGGPGGVWDLRRVPVPNVCDRKTDLLLQMWYYLSLRSDISVVPVEWLMKEMRPTDNIQLLLCVL
jgi:hypothetical protein